MRSFLYPPRIKLPFSLFPPRLTFPRAVASRANLRDFQSRKVDRFFDQGGEHTYCMAETQPRSMKSTRETKQQKRSERYNEASEREEDKVRNGRKERERETWRRRTTPRDVYDSGALLLYSMCQCVSRWRPAEVDGLAFGRHRRRSGTLGTRSVMESLAAPSVEAMTPSTPLLPPNARRFPSVSPLGVSTAGARYPTTADGSAALPSLRSSPTIPARSRFSSPPHARGKRKERQGGREGEPPMPALTPRAADGCSTLGAFTRCKIRACPC